MVRVIKYFYGLVCYAVCFATCIYAVGFIAAVAVPKTIDSGPVAPAAQSFAANLILLTIFAVQHSAMARSQFKRWCTQFIPAAIERATYVLCSSLALALLFWQWRPMPELVWHVTDPTGAIMIKSFSIFGWLVVRIIFLINHFELVGPDHAAGHRAGRMVAAMRFRSPLLYRFVRHPIYFGFIIAFWVTPAMTAGHLLFATVITAYIFVGILLEERELAGRFGDDRRHKNRTPMPVASRPAS